MSDPDKSKSPGAESLAKLTRRRFLWAASSLLAFRAARLRASPLAQLPRPILPLCLATSKTSYPPMLAKFIAKLDPAADGFPSEVYAAEIDSILEAWSVALRRAPRDLGIVAARLSPRVSASSLKPVKALGLRNQAPLLVERRFFAEPLPVSAMQFRDELEEYFSAWSSIETAELQIYGLVTVSESPLVIESAVRCDFVGRCKDGAREQRVSAWQMQWTRSEGGGWTVERWKVNDETRSHLTGPGFTEITAECLAVDTPGMAQLQRGIDHWRTALDGASGMDVYGNHGIAVGDIDGSGFDSFYVCQPSGLPNRLYRNRGDGTFEDITEHSGTGILDGTASALFADFQNRGKQDLLVIRSSGPLLFNNVGSGRFQPDPAAFQFAQAPQGTFTSAAIADYDRDGHLDVYMCVYSYYQGLNQYAYPTPYYDAQNGPPNFLFRNRGDGTFEDVTAASGMNENNNRFSFAAAWCDYDNDGWPDLYVANDFGRKNLYRSNGDGTFSDVAAKASVEDYGPGMSACWLDHDNDGRQDLYVANMWLPEGKRITANEQFLPGVDPAIRALYQKHNAGNSFYRNDGKAGFENKTIEAGTSMGRWSWSCASWDFDNDGRSDLYVANGFVSGPNRQDLQSFFWRQVAQRSMTPAGVSTDYELAWNAVNELVRSDYSWSGYQRNVFFSNNHDGTFSDVSGVLGLDLVDDSRAFSLSDFDHDGRLEFVLKNRTGPQLRMLRNGLQDIGNSITLRLAGRTSNRDGIGAVVTLESGAARQTKFISAGSGFASQHTKELHFGVGSSAGPIAISVRWPTGVVEHFANLPVNQRITIEEGRPSFISQAYSPAKTARASVAAPAVPAEETVKTWLVAPLFGPDLNLAEMKGARQRLSSLQGHPVLLTFLRNDCVDSRKQLDLLEQSSSSLTHANLALYIVAVDPTDDAGAANNSPTVPLKSSLPIRIADAQTAGAWNIQYRYLFDRRRDMALPLSFLLDATGAIVRVYQGVVEPATAVTDSLSITSATQESSFHRAMPFAGPYYGGPMKHDYLTFGIAFAEYGYVDEALAAFLRATEANPAKESAWFNLGTLYLSKKMYPEARKYMGEAARLNPQDADAWNNLGMISGEEEKYDEALSQFKRAATVNPNHQLAIENMMRIYRFQGRAADAQTSLEELIAHAPQNADLHLALAMALVAQSDLKRARQELETSVQLKPNNPDALNNLGAVLLRLGQAPDALARFEEARRLSPEFDRPCINAALVYNSMGQSTRARQVLTEFLARHPDNSDVRSALDKMTSAGAQ